MAAEDTQEMIVGGFAFGEEQDVRKARKEQEGIRYIKSKIDMSNPEMVLQMYHQIIKEQLFETPVGYSYLKELQEYLTIQPIIRKEDIQPIPILRQQSQGKKQVKPEKSEGKAKPEKKVEIKERNVNYKTRYKGAVVVIVSLLVIVAAMFAITMTSNNLNILNYENELINRYEEWQQELEEREQAVKEREAALQ